ncbi:MAG: branched-chain amino acid ABC transporter substrate-binding protein [Betaproteobacteria bacterium]
MLRRLPAIAAPFVVAMALVTAGWPPAWSASTVRIALLAPLGGAMALQGESVSRQLHAAADDINAGGGLYGGAKLEIVDFDDQLSPQQGLLALQSAIGSDIRFVTQGIGSNVGLALSDAIAKHNSRNPEQPVLFLNYGGLDPDMTNSKCQFWHFRFDANSDMRATALAEYLRSQPRIHKIYLINQDYAWGQAVSRAARQTILARRPDVSIVGDDLHPLAKVKDFAPYVAKIRASGADAVVTGNWGSDLSLLVRASREAGLDVQYFVLGTALKGLPTTLGRSGEGNLKVLVPWVRDEADARSAQFADDFRRKSGDDWSFEQFRHMLRMFAAATNQAHSLEPLAVARALEGMRLAGDTGELWMRAEDHQLFNPLFIATLARSGTKGVSHDWEGSGYGWRADATIAIDTFRVPTTCRMTRP